jgi:SpoVK/Ycf46/Vps4 family AAA+-type ATPase
VFKAILRDVKKDSSFDCKVCSAMTEGYTPSDITALCGAAVSAVHSERSATIQKNKIAAEKLMKKEKAEGVDSKEDSTKSSEVPLRALRIAVSTHRQTYTQTDIDRHIYGHICRQMHADRQT